jgi:PmbA protein
MHSYLHGHPALTLAIKKLERLNPDQFELYFESRKWLKIDSKNQAIDTLSRAEDVGLSIRVIRDHRLGFSYTTSLLPQAIEKAVQTAFEITSVMPEDPNNGLFSFGSAVYPAVDNYDTHGYEVALIDKVALAKSLESACRKADSRITGVRSASISETCLETHLVDSSGEHIQHRSSGYSASITCKAESNGDTQMGGEYAFSNFLDTLPVEATGLLAAEWATELLGAKPAPTMKCPAVFRNSVVADLLDFLSSSFSAEQIDKGRSMLAGKKDQRVFSEKVTIIDDGLLPAGAGTGPFDGEGVPTGKSILVDGGFFSTLLCDFYYSKKNGVEPSGCSHRGIKSPPSIGFSNLYIQKGHKSPASLYDGMSKGILITDLMGIHTANPVTGDFSLGASGILIEKGKLTRPVRGFAVAGNILDLFSNITDLGNDLKFFGNVGAPSILLDEISVGGL